MVEGGGHKKEREGGVIDIMGVAGDRSVLQSGTHGSRSRRRMHQWKWEVPLPSADYGVWGVGSWSVLQAKFVSI